MKIKSYTMREALKPAIIKCSKNQGYKIDIFTQDLSAEKKLCNYIKDTLLEVGCLFVINIRFRIFTMPDGGVICVHRAEENCNEIITNLLLVDDRINKKHLLDKIHPRIIPYEYDSGIMLNPKPLFIKVTE